MSTKTQTAKTAASKNGSANGSTATEKNGGAKKVEVKETPIVNGNASAKSIEQLVKERQQMRSKLDALYEDVEALETAKKQFDGIRSFGEISISISGEGGHRFTTSRTDTVEAVLGTIKNSIEDKLSKANAKLADFAF